MIGTSYIPKLDNTSFYKCGLLKAFYTSVRTDVLKLQVRDYGFDFIDIIEKTGIKLEYGEMKDGYSSLKLTNVNENIFNFLLKSHVEKAGNLCAYYHQEKNNVCILNFDDMAKGAAKEEVSLAIVNITELLKKINVIPLVYISGRGYHLAFRFTTSIDNAKLNKFLTRLVVHAKIVLKAFGHNSDKINIGRYPSDNEDNVNSLRLFGSSHIEKNIFSHICLKSGVLSEEASWLYLKDYMKDHTLSESELDIAIARLDKPLDIILDSDIKE